MKMFFSIFYFKIDAEQTIVNEIVLIFFFYNFELSLVKLHNKQGMKVTCNEVFQLQVTFLITLLVTTLLFLVT